MCKLKQGIISGLDRTEWEEVRADTRYMKNKYIFFWRGGYLTRVEHLRDVGVDRTRTLVM
jgi:hypothetical protein